MTLARFASRPVPRAGALLLVLGGLGALALGGVLAGQAALGPDDRLVFLRDARLERAAARVDEAASRAAEIAALRRRGGPDWYVAREIDEAERFFADLRLVRDEQLRENARRWRRTQALMGGWLGLAGLVLLAAGARQWRRAGAVAGTAAPP
jgi:hypothetical protein